jgi:hypothetical protein
VVRSSGEIGGKTLWRECWATSEAKGGYKHLELEIRNLGQNKLLQGRAWPSFVRTVRLPEGTLSLQVFRKNKTTLQKTNSTIPHRFCSYLEKPSSSGLQRKGREYTKEAD